VPPVLFGRAGRPSHFQESKLFNSHSLGIEMCSAFSLVLFMTPLSSLTMAKVLLGVAESSYENREVGNSEDVLTRLFHFLQIDSFIP
ncbi:hypothetical protein, partial [Microcoleus sp. S13_D1]